nr:sensor histidine kinase [Paenibacillus sp. SYP-B3998]
MRVLRNWIFILTVICIIGVVSLAYVPITRFSKRTQLIIRAMKKLQMGDLSVRIPVEKDDELYQIADHFNMMVLDLKTHIDKVYLSELNQKNVEMIALQSQINPHFLYNTLEAIRMRAISQGAKDAGEMIYILAMLFRNSIKKDMVVTLLEEIEHCKLCLELFSIRYKDRLSYDLDIAPEVMQSQVIKLTLQPIIENYLVHGVRMDDIDNLISIQAFVRDEELVIEVRDNGNGISADKLEQLRQSLQLIYSFHTPGPSIGLRNVNERIKLYFGSEYGLEIESTPGIGTNVIVKIPYQ